MCGEAKILPALGYASLDPCVLLSRYPSILKNVKYLNIYIYIYTFNIQLFWNKFCFASERLDGFRILKGTRGRMGGAEIPLP